MSDPRCSGCGQPAEFGAAFCYTCGTPLAQQTPPGAASFQLVVPEDAALRCRNCGGDALDADGDCTACGAGGRISEPALTAAVVAAGGAAGFPPPAPPAAPRAAAAATLAPGFSRHGIA